MLATTSVWFKFSGTHIIIVASKKVNHTFANLCCFRRRRRHHCHFCCFLFLLSCAGCWNANQMFWIKRYWKACDFRWFSIVSSSLRLWLVFFVCLFVSLKAVLTNIDNNYTLNNIFRSKWIWQKFNCGKHTQRDIFQFLLHIHIRFFSSFFETPISCMLCHQCYVVAILFCSAVY